MNSAVCLAALVLALASPALAQEVPVPQQPSPDQPLTTLPRRPRACERWLDRGLTEGPVAVGFYDSELGTGHRACPRTEISLGARLGLTIDTPGFYGNVAVDALLQGSVVVGSDRRAEIFATLPVVEFQFVQNASLKGTALSLGNLTVGGAWVALLRERVAVTPYVKLLVPTASAPADVRTLGGELGLSLTYRPLSRLEVHGVLAGDVSAGLGAGPADTRGGALVIAGLQYNPFTRLGLALDLDLHLGQRAALDYFAPALGLRFRLYRTLGLELAGTLPVVGADRRAALALLRLTYRF